MKRGKVVRCEVIKLPNCEVMKEIEKEGFTYLGIVAINSWAGAVFRYGTGMLQWKDSELNVVDRKPSKTMKMYGVLHPKSKVDRLYIKRKGR